MDANECYRKYRNARMRFANELETIEKDFISSNYSFKKGDIVRFKNYFYQTPKLVCIEKLYLTAKKEDDRYRYPHVAVYGFVVDEEGYLVPIMKGGSQPTSCSFDADEIIEVTAIQYKGLR